MAILGTTGLESHPDGVGDLNAIVNDNWLRLNEMFSPTYGLTAAQTTTTVTSSADLFIADDVGATIRFADGTTRTISAYINATSVTVSVSGSVASQAFELYFSSETPIDAIARGLTKRRRMQTSDDGGFLQWDGTLGRFVATTPFLTGMIIMWSGQISTIPTGWALCNGSGGTPDLRDRFVVGATADDSGQAKTNITGSLTKTGGSVTHTHTNPTTASSTDTLPVGTDVMAGVGFAATTTGHTHTQGDTGSAGTLPSYYALAFIMKT